MKRLLMTGGSGLVGGNLGPRLGVRFAVMTVGRSRPEWSAEHVNCDFATPWEADQLPRQYDTLIHLAQSDHFRDFPGMAESIFETNVKALLKLLEHARCSGVKRVVLASSGGVYGTGEKSFSESDLLNASDSLGFYLGTKVAAEIMASNYAQYFNLIILRFFFIYGPGQKSGMLMPRIIQSVREGKAITLQGHHGIRLNPIFVPDAAKAVVQSLDLDGFHRLNVAGPQAVSMRELGNLVGTIIGRTPVFSMEEKAVPKHLVGDISQMSSVLGAPATSLEAGLRQTIAASQAA